MPFRPCMLVARRYGWDSTPACRTRLGRDRHAPTNLPGRPCFRINRRGSRGLRTAARVRHSRTRMTFTGRRCDHGRRRRDARATVGNHCGRGTSSWSAGKGYQARDRPQDRGAPARSQVPPSKESDAAMHGGLCASQVPRRGIRRRMLLARLPRPHPRGVPRPQRGTLAREDQNQQERDTRNTEQATAAGWTVLRIWECEIRRDVEESHSESPRPRTRTARSEADRLLLTEGQSQQVSGPFLPAGTVSDEWTLRTHRLVFPAEVHTDQPYRGHA